MKEQLQQVIDSMRKHVLKNLELIKTNENHIKEVLGRPLSTERTKDLNDSYQYSKTLLSENNDFINFQVSIMNFLNKYKHIVESESTVKVNAVSAAKYSQHLSREDYFNLTIANDIPFDAVHPYFKDKEFLNDLFTYFEQTENYEMCAKLFKISK
jgi:hypothetical protein